MLTPRQRWVVGAGVVAVALVEVSWFLPLYGEICRKDAYSGHKDCASYHLVLVIGWHIGEILNYYSGAVAAVATALLAFITYRLVALGKEQSDTTRAQLRAYVLIKTAFFARNPNGLGPWGVQIELQNFGQTPAKNVRVIIERDIRQTIAENAIIPLPVTAQARPPAPIGPGHFMTIHWAAEAVTSIGQRQGRAGDGLDLRRDEPNSE